MAAVEAIQEAADQAMSEAVAAAAAGGGGSASAGAGAGFRRGTGRTVGLYKLNPTDPQLETAW
jgi:hypothetical protein